jgi:cell wall-associated NlpC family hydrolase
MSAVQLLFTRRRHPGSALIRVTTWSDWSHVDLIDGQSVLGAVAFHGVERELLATRLANASRAEVMTIPCADAKAVIEAAKSQIGKPYDWLGVFGIGLHRDWQDPDRWFCSELVAWAFDVAGQPLFRRDSLRRVTPQHLWMLAPLPSTADAVAP